MGSSQLSLAVKISYRPQGSPKTNLHTKALQVCKFLPYFFGFVLSITQLTIHSRAPLLLNNLDGNFGHRENLNDDAAGWCSSCKVVVVDKIIEELRFGNEVDTIKNRPYCVKLSNHRLLE
jgi:hypothetical protein